MQYAYDMLDRPDFSTSLDAGQRRTFSDTTGLPLYRWDAKGNRIHTIYDVLHRPLQHVLRASSNAILVIERFVYGTDKTKNQNGKLLTHFDKSYRITCDAYDFKGNLLTTTRTYTMDYIGDIDWSTPAAVTLEARSFSSQSVYDALNRVTASVSPDGSVTSISFSEAGLLAGIDGAVQGAASQPFITHVTHDAKGQRLRVDRANGTSTLFDYDPLTFRIRRIRTLPNSGSPSFQDLNYTYDPAGNITQVRDDAQRTIFFNNQVISPQNDFAYDAAYRLISATGREHVGQNAPVSEFDDFRTNPPNSSDITALRNYLQQYEYDFSGNLLNMVHSSGTGPFTNQWTRQFFPNVANNRLDSSQVGTVTENYSYDVHGNMISIPGLPTLNWDFNDQLRSIDLGGGGTVYYTYDGKGNRARKVVERLGGIKEERMYLDTAELFIRRQGPVTKLERWSLHIMDGERRIVLIDKRTAGDDGTPLQLIRYQFSNHLGTATLELDDGAGVISYEEFYPFGSTSFQGLDSSRQLPPKRYRYTGKERDEETGLYYHGARYLAPWLGRWTACDPAGMKDGTNLYSYVRANPVRLTDPQGTDSDDPKKGKSPPQKKDDKPEPTQKPAAPSVDTEKQSKTKEPKPATDKPSKPKWAGENIILPKNVVEALQAYLPDDKEHLHFRELSDKERIIKTEQKDPLQVPKGYGYLQIEEGYQSSKNPLLWSNLQKVVESKEKLLLGFSSPKIGVKTTMYFRKDDTSKIEATDITDIMREAGLTLASKSLTKRIFGETLPPAGTKATLTSPYENLSVIYLLSGQADKKTIAHELLGHFFFAASGLPYGHDASLKGKSINDPEGKPFEGTVKEYIDKFVAPR